MSIDSEIYALNCEIDELTGKIEECDRTISSLNYVISDFENVIQDLELSETDLNTYYKSDTARKKAEGISEERVKLTSDKAIVENTIVEIKQKMEQMSNQISANEEQIRQLQRRKKELEAKKNASRRRNFEK